jgi:hypothetical protein
MSSKDPARPSSRRSPTSGALVYEDYRENFVIWPGRDAALDAFVRQSYTGLGQHKLRHTRSSNSEDALTWSCFDTLDCLSGRARADALKCLWVLAFGEKPIPSGLPGAKIWVGKQYGEKGEKTEVDASIEGDGLLVFIEAKLYSSISLADGKKQDQIARKLQVGIKEAGASRDFYLIVLDIAPKEILLGLKPRTRIKDAKNELRKGFAGKWITADTYNVYKQGSGKIQGVDVKAVADNIGWLTWTDVYKVVLRAVIASVGPKHDG